jgi:signal transduction histidine kinase
MDAHSEEEQMVFLELLEKSTFRLDSTLKNLTEILSITSSHLPKKDINLFEEIKKTRDGLSAKILHLDIEFDIDVNPDFYVRAVPGYLDSILLNLLDNAVKYKSEDRRCKITCRAYKTGATNVIEIEDNGLGLDLNKYGSKLFGMYKTFHGNEDAQGLGLFITKTQIESMDGTIDAESQVDVGTLFRIKLPG